MRQLDHRVKALNVRLLVDRASDVSFPDQPQRFKYEQGKFREDERYLVELVETIQGLDEDQFPLTADESRCTFCVYRSLCNRGIQAGSLDEYEIGDEATDDGLEITLDFEQIGEIEF